MKDKFFFLSTILLFVIPYSCQVNTTDVQVSESSSSSKRNGFFEKKYALQSTTDKNIILEDAWVEKTWYNRDSNIKSTKIEAEEKTCQLCFKLRQVSGLKYQLANYLNWIIEYKPSGARVGIKFSRNFIVYNIEFADCNIPDTVSLDLIERKDLNSEIKDINVGTMVLKVENVNKK